MTDDPALGSQPFCFLTTTGRVTGRPHRIEIWFALNRTVAYVLSGDRERADWVRNLLVSPQVTLEIGDAKRSTAARVLEPGTDEDALARRLLLQKYGGGGEDLTEWARTSLPVAIDWHAAA